MNSKTVKLIAALLISLLVGGSFSACGTEPATSEKSSPEKKTSAENKMTIDLTSLTSTMAYSRLFAIMAEPEDYDGGTLIMEGQFLPMKEKGKMRYFCVVTDEAGCCAQAIEMIPAKDLKYPDDYPKEQDDISVKGVFTVNSEGSKGDKSCLLKNAEVNKL